MPSTSIKTVNIEVKTESEKCRKAHALYMVMTPEQKAKVGKYIAKNGTINVILHFTRELLSLKKYCVRVEEGLLV